MVPGEVDFVSIRLSEVKSETNAHKGRVCRKLVSVWPGVDTTRLTSSSVRKGRALWWGSELVALFLAAGTLGCYGLCSGRFTRRHETVLMS